MNFQESEQQKWESEEWHCVNQFLNKLKVPKEDDKGQRFSTVGRISELMRMCQPGTYPDRGLSDNDFVDNLIHTISKIR